MRKILIATVKPFAPVAVKQISEIFNKAGYELQLLERYEAKQELLDAIVDADAAIIRSDKFDEEVLNAGKKLRIVVRAGAGYDNVNLETASEKNIVVMNTPGQNSNAVAELVFGMLVFVSRGLFNGKAGTEIKDKNIGIHAYGNVGSRVAKIAIGFGMNVYAFDPFVSAETMEKEGVTMCDSVEELYSKCQYISLHLPASEDTKASINYDLLSKIPENGVLVNTARKEVIDENELLKVLEVRPDFKYISDIAPVCKHEIIEKFPGQYFFTPNKMGAQTAEANLNAGLAAAQQIVDFFEKGHTTYQVNK